MRLVNPETYDMLNKALYVDDLYYDADIVEQGLKLSVDAVF